MEDILRIVREQNLVNDSTPSVDAIDLDYLARRLDLLKASCKMVAV